MNLATTFIIGSMGLKKINDLINHPKNRYNKKNIIDDLIEKKIKEQKNENKNKKYVLGKFKSTRKIPDQQKLKSIYDNFLKKNNIIQKSVKNKDFQFYYKKENCLLKEDQCYLMFDLNLLPSKNYRIYVSFEIEQSNLLSFLFHNKNNVSFSITNEKNNNKIKFISNIISKNFYSKYTQSQFYILFDKVKKNIHLTNVLFEIKELQDDILYPMTLIENNQYYTIY